MLERARIILGDLKQTKTLYSVENNESYTSTRPLQRDKNTAYLNEAGGIVEYGNILEAIGVFFLTKNCVPCMNSFLVEIIVK